MATGDLSFVGDVSKLIQIGANHGPIFVLNQEPVTAKIKSLADAVRIEPFLEDISVFITSKRFGNRIKISVPRAIRAAALMETLVDLLRLPRNYRIEEIRLELVFKYTLLYNNSRIGPFSPICDFGVENGSELEILIDFGWKDPVSSEPEKTTWGGTGGAILFSIR